MKADLKNVDYDIEAFSNEGYGAFIMQNLAEAMGEEGVYTTMVASLTNGSHNEWADAAVEYQKEHYPNMTLLEDNPRVESDDNGDTAYNVAKELIKTYPDLKGIFCNNMSNPIGAAQAVVDAGKDGDITLVGMDHDLRALEYLRDGTISALGVQDCYKMGFDTIQVAIMIADGLEPGDDTYPEQTEEQTTIVYPEDAQAMIDKLYPDSK